MKVRTLEDINLIEKSCVLKSRKSFYAYRQYMSGFRLKTGWFVRTVSKELQQFYDDYKEGKRPILVIESPPQHGKSSLITDGISWMAGNDPNLRFIFASFSERLGIRTNKNVKRAMETSKYNMIFPEVGIPSSKDSGKESNVFMREFTGGEGSFRNTTVQGSITGETLDIGLIDDPIRGRKDANSENVRNATWEWFTDDFFTRFDEMAGLIIVLTRWHIDDPVGRLLDSEMGDRVKVLKFKAIAEQDEEHREEGEALFPEHKSLEFLEGRKKVMSSDRWSSLYQQNPIVLGGNIFKLDHWKYYKVPPAFKRKMIFADTAQKTKEQNDFSVFQCWGQSFDNGLYLIDQVRGKWEAPELKTTAKAFYNKHRNANGRNISAFKVEDKSSGTGLIQSLRKEGLPIVGIPRDVDKVTRALDTVPLIESGNVYLPEDAPWLSDYLTEFSAFPNGTHDDQIDPTMDAVKEFLGGYTRNYGDVL